MTSRNNIIKFKKGAKTLKNPELLYCFKCKVELEENKKIFSKPHGKHSRRFYHKKCAELAKLI